MADSQAQLGMVPSLILAESMAFFMSARLVMIVFLLLQ